MRWFVLIAPATAVLVWCNVQCTATGDPGTAAVTSRQDNAGDATPRSAASEKARQGSGRVNPFSAISGFKPLRLEDNGSQKLPSANKSKDGHVPPPTTPEEMAGKGQFVPPPPPLPGGRSPLSGDNQLPMSEMPAPPSKPTVAGQLKLTGIVGDRAIFAITDAELRGQKKWPRNITLGVGEQFESASVLSIDKDTVTLEEDGERFVKELSRIR